ncbi:MAG: hypothetical protein ACK2U1_05340, partial [Anaerolineales bacterium]
MRYNRSSKSYYSMHLYGICGCDVLAYPAHHTHNHLAMRKSKYSLNEAKMIDVNNLRKGVTFEHDGNIWKVLEYSH